MGKKVPGRRTFLAGACCLVTFGAVHGLAVLHALFGAPSDPEVARIQTELKDYTQRFGPLEVSMWGAIQLLNQSFSLFAIWAGTLDLALLGPALAADKLRRLAGLNVLFSGLLLALTVASRFPPPMVFAAVTWALFVVAWWRSASADDLLPTDEAA